jgi:hypothetical protein
MRGHGGGTKRSCPPSVSANRLTSSPPVHVGVGAEQFQAETGVEARRTAARLRHQLRPEHSYDSIIGGIDQSQVDFLAAESAAVAVHNDVSELRAVITDVEIERLRRDGCGAGQRHGSKPRRA